MKSYMKMCITICMMTTVETYHYAADSTNSWMHSIKEKVGMAPQKEVKKEMSLSLAENIAVGGIVGAAEVAFPGQMLSYAMNQAIKKEAFVLTKSYAGFTANALGQMPIVAMQKVVQVMGSDKLEKWQGSSLSEKQKIGISYLAGVAGAMIDTPCNAIQLFLQDKANIGKTTRHAIKELGAKAYRGFGANALMKEGPFAVGYQYLAGKCRAGVQPYVGDNMSATALGGSIAGVVTAVVTQPGAVIRNKMQSDLCGDRSMYSSIWSTAQKIYKEGGARALFTGLKQRGVRVAIAVPLYVAYTKALEAKLKMIKKVD